MANSLISPEFHSGDISITPHKLLAKCYHNTLRCLQEISIHNAVKNALVEEGWIITDGPLHLKWDQKDMYLDLGAKQFLAAEQGSKKIAVEIKSFISPSEMADFKDAIGGFIMYRAVIHRLEPKEHYIWQCATAYLQPCLRNRLVHF